MSIGTITLPISYSSIDYIVFTQAIPSPKTLSSSELNVAANSQFVCNFKVNSFDVVGYNTFAWLSIGF